MTIASSVSSVSGLRWACVLLIANVALLGWRAVERAVEDTLEHARSAPRAARPVTYRHVPLLGLPLMDAVDDADGDQENRPAEAPAGPVQTCLPFLAPILEYPGWQLRLTHGHGSCFGDQVMGSFAIDATGAVTWTRPGWPVRHLALSGEQLALVRRLDQLSCVELFPEGDEPGFLSIGLDLGKHQAYGGAYVPPASVLGRAVTALLRDLEAQYRQPRREAIESMELQLATTEAGAVYRIRIAGDRVTVRHGQRLLVDEPVDADELMDVIDALLTQPTADESDVKGVLLIQGLSVPVAFWRWERGPFQMIHNAIQKAQYNEEQAREAREARAE
ncbi:MAG TPA: hypothetical protein VNO30_40890 [Kofleriaceae bacterium]|nr:hypothetical protein [Kofleriaceae bacterium]